ncbi:MAG TPA: hypothetical protein GX747_04155, partial [Tenericutes bacterium]|nr:hypothetical protein [Mycoplasmatota bacterium]
MLEFNNEHKSINGSLKNQKNKVKIRNFILGGVVVASIFLFSGCVKNVECNIIGPHAHKYVSELSYDKYMISEKEHEGKWVRTDDYISISKNMEELIEFENKNGLYRISLNEDNIAETVSSHIDTVEYRYQYRW